MSKATKARALVESLIDMEAFQCCYAERPILTSAMRIYQPGIWSCTFVEDEGYEMEDNPGTVFVNFNDNYITFTSELIYIRVRIINIPYLIFQEILDNDKDGMVLKGTEEEIKYFNKRVSDYGSFNKE